MPDYDVVAVNLSKNKQCKISVKYRKASDSDGFRLRSIDVFVFFIGVIGKRGEINGDKSKDLKIYLHRF